jgi:hypothetical protein
MVVNALIRGFIKGGMISIIKLEFGEVPVPLYFLGKVFVKLLL